MSDATAWVELAKQERAAHRRAWGTIPQQQAQPKKPTEPKGTYNPERLALIKEMVSEGFSNTMIAEELGVTDSSIRYWRKQYKLR